MSFIEDCLVRDEGEKLKPYFDCCGKFFRDCTCPQEGKKQGKLTIGVGRNIEDVGISKTESRYLLNNDIVRATDEASRNFPWLPALDDIRKTVVIMMTFNMGAEKLLGFKNFLTALKAKDFARAKNEMLNSKWASQVKSRAARLAEMILNGKPV